MNRQGRFLWLIGFLVLTLTLAPQMTRAQVGDQIIPGVPLPETLVTKPYIQDVTETSVAVVWETTVPVIGSVDYGLQAPNELTVTEAVETKHHRVEITELPPGTVYHFRVRYGDVALDPARFMTAEVDEYLMPEEPMPEGLNIRPYLQNVTQHGIVVMWETLEPVVGSVEYGETAAYGKSVTEEIAATIHELLIPDLEPGETYYYRARYGDVILEGSRFRTAPPDGTREAKILLYGDSRSYPKRHRRVVEQMVPFEPDLIINTGDLVSNGQQYKLWRPQHFWPLEIVADHIPVYVVLGNHERNSKYYFNYFSLPGNEVFYSFDYANIHFIVLDSNSGYTPYGKDSPQYQWLKEDLERNKDAEWLIVCLHHPLFRVHPGRGIEGQRYVWQQLFDQYGVDLVVGGHDHHYGRIRPIGELKAERRNGVTYITTGGGGASLYDVTEDRSYIAIARKLHNIVKLTVRGDRAEAVVTDIHGNLVETFVLDKNEMTSPEDYIAYEVFEVERDLRDAVAELDPLTVRQTGDTVSIDTTLRIPTSFDVRLEGTITWTLPQTDEDGNVTQQPVTESETQWMVSSKPTEFAINPGAELRIPVRAEATHPDLYPIPALTIDFSKIVGRLPIGFRNHTITFHPIKLRTLVPLEVPHIHQGVYVQGQPAGVHLDGELGEPAWVIAHRLSRFVTEQGDVRPTRALQVRLVHDGNYLYAGAQIEADTSVVSNLLARSPRARDDRYILRGEFFGLYLATPEATYTFGIDPHGSQVDAKDSDRGWNLDWYAVAEQTDTGWAVEVAIPISAIWPPGDADPLGINIVRWDDALDQAAMLVPSFTPRGTENRLPEYVPGVARYPDLPSLVLVEFP